MEPGYLFPFSNGKWPLAAAKAGRNGLRSGDPRAALDFRCGCSTCQGDDELPEEEEWDRLRSGELEGSAEERGRDREEEEDDVAGSGVNAGKDGGDGRRGEGQEHKQEYEERFAGRANGEKGPDEGCNSEQTAQGQRQTPRRRGKQKQRPPWRKALYISQPYADNHTDPETFLSGLVMNADVSTPSYWPTVEASLVVAHEVATVALVVAVFAFNYLDVLSLRSLYSLNISFLIGGLMLAGLAEAGAALENQQASSLGPHSSPCLHSQPNQVPVSPRTPREALTPSSSAHGAIPSNSPGPAAAVGANSWDGGTSCASPTLRGLKRESSQGQVEVAVKEWCTVVSTCALIGLYTLLLSPIIHTLARSISSDTIWCTTTYLLLLHLFLHDYSYLAALSSNFSSYLALLSALFACVLLSSRLPEAESAFAFVSFGLQCFGLLPGILHRVARASHRSHRVVVVLLLTLSVGLVCLLNQLLGVTLILVLLFVVVVSPGVLVHMHRSYKSTIHGPWDEAKLQISRAPSRR